MSQFLFADDSIEAMSMEESTEELYIEPGVQLAPVCDNPRYKAGCDPTTAKCRDDDPERVWAKQRYSICRGGGAGRTDTSLANRCECYWEHASSDGFAERCKLHKSLYIDKRGIWNSNYMKELLKSIGINK
jgi:hypothetical protein